MTNEFQDVEGATEPIINLLAWCYKLKQQYDFIECAEELQTNVELLQESYGPEKASFEAVLTFLLCLKDLPKKRTNKLDLSTLPDIDDQISDFNALFKFPSSLLEAPPMDYQSFDMFKLSHRSESAELIKKKSSPLLSDSEGNSISNKQLLKDEGYSSPNKESIWDLVTQMSFSKQRNWENYGHGPPEKERPFMSELGELSSLWVENLDSLYLANNLHPSVTVMSSKLKPRKIFIRDLKYLLVGMPSETFNLSAKNEFFKTPGIMQEGLAPDTFASYCQSFIFAGTCYRALNQMATPDPNTRKYKYDGYIFAELCESIARYLQFFRTAILGIPDEVTFLRFHETTYKLQVQVSTLASICKIGPFSFESGEMPHGVALLNYLYQEILGLNDKHLCMVLYSILYPCCQIYFSRFLHQWLTKGTLSDPYGEFFVSPNFKYLSSRGRIFWIKGYSVKEDIIPDFLIDLKHDILLCGRIMNFLHICAPMNKLFVYLMGQNRFMLTCCLTHDKLTSLEQSISKYYLEALAECGPKFSFSKVFERDRETDLSYLQLIAKKRATTLRRIELERQKAAEELREKKLEELLMLKEQYETALEEKQLKIYKEIEREIKTIQEDLEIEQMRQQLIENEAKNMIDYYSELHRVSEERKEKIENHVKCITKIHIDTGIGDKEFKSAESIPEKINSSSESFYSVPNDVQMAESIDLESEKGDLLKHSESQRKMHSSESMDVINANVRTELLECIPEQQRTETKETISTVNSNPTIQQTIDNFELARKIKKKVLNQELGIAISDWSQNREKPIKPGVTYPNLTEAQRNKLRVLSSEFGIESLKDNVKTDRVITVAVVNRNKIMGHNECFIPNYGVKTDNASFVNKNVKEDMHPEKGESKTTQVKKSVSLQLDLNKTKSDGEKPIPMSVDSTPMSDMPFITTPLSDLPRSVTPSSMFLSTDTKIDSFPTTADTGLTEEAFSFPSSFSRLGRIESFQKPESHIPIFSKRVPAEEAKNISKNSLNSLNLFLHESVNIPLQIQLKLANNEILKYFIDELKFLRHLQNIRDYFFLQDGEFGRSITENLFEKLYSVNFPLELINFRTLQHLVFSALDNSNKSPENAGNLSFKINNNPKCFDLGDPDVLSCISLTYKVQWPLNVLLPSDAFAKYDQVFKFLLTINRISWVLKKIFLELKMLAKETGNKEIYLMSSPQYRHLHQCRHVMSHFMQTFQNYIVGEVLQPSWSNLEKVLMGVSTIDELYNAHSYYIKDIMFRCLLNQKSAALKSLINKIFIVILKFFHYLRSGQWSNENGTYVHPNFDKLEKIYKNFEEFVIYLFRTIRKVVGSGCQPQLIQFLDVLDVNDFYSKKLKKQRENSS
ncbi:gamma-tubulin complex component 6 isoform X2 [Anthonomus grandis grandis]|uniref:gamma-tubulin complex component 6 isoform X2 n=1 Tax=Anthonomus grandis grandis TaxID=2921223 RepID=UPI00216681E0|nr:gamma-tubulin complex component 6 isoform X2 [Anthonomus grandis grandis]